MQKLHLLIGMGIGLALAVDVSDSLIQRGPIAQAAPNETRQVAVVFSEGHETEGRDRGRPVILIASALGVPAEVFREAFSHVHPAPAGQQPDPQEVRRNKDALLQALAPYGVTNERLDEVSNYYRYRRDQGEIWPTKPAQADALLRGGKIVGFEVKSGGSGYSSPPIVSVPGLNESAARVELGFSQTFKQNGAVSAIKIH